MNETNRSIIVLLAALWIILMGVIVFLTWAADKDTVNRLQDFVQYLDDHRTTAGRLIVTLSALTAAVLALLVIVIELAPEEQVKELRIEQAGATTIVPADALRLRLEEALTALPQVSAARVRVSSQAKGIDASLDLTVSRSANIGLVTQEAGRVVVDTIQTELGLPLARLPAVRIAFSAAAAAPVASSVSRPPSPPATAAAPDVSAPETVDERVEPAPTAGQAPEGALPGPAVQAETPPEAGPGGEAPGQQQPPEHHQQ